MSRFLHDATPQENAAINMLRMLPDLDSRMRTFATAIAPELLKNWLRDSGLKQSSGHQCLCKLVTGHPHDPLQLTGLCHLPGADHNSVWYRPGTRRPCVFITQPYQLGLEQLSHLVNLCQAHRLHLTIFAHPSWHFPSRTITLHLTREDDQLSAP